MEVGANIWYQRLRSMEPSPCPCCRPPRSEESFDPTLQFVLEELQRMEARLDDRIEGRCSGLECRIDADEQWAEEMQKIDASSGSLLQHVDVFNAAHIFDEEFDAGPIFDEELGFDAGPIFDEEPSDFTTASCGVVLSGGPGITTAMVGHATASPRQATSTSSTHKVSVHDSVLAADALSTMDTKPSYIDIDAPFTCLTKCLSGVVGVAVPAAVFASANELVLDPSLVAAASSTCLIIPITTKKVTQATHTNCLMQGRNNNMHSSSMPVQSCYHFKCLQGLLHCESRQLLLCSVQRHLDAVSCNLHS